MILPQAQRVVKARSFWRLHLTFADVEYEYWNQRRVLMPNIGKDGHPKLWSLIFVLIIALTFCCFVMGQGLNSGTSVFLAGQGYGASLAGVLALVFSIAAALARLFVGPVIDNGKCSLVIIAGIAILIAGTALSAVVQGIPSSQSAVCCKAWALAQQQQQPRPPQQASYRKNGSAKALDTTASDRLSP